MANEQLYMTLEKMASAEFEEENSLFIGHAAPVKSEEEALAYSRSIGLAPLRIEPVGEAKHIFSHVEWQMVGYSIRVDELENSCTEDMLFIHPEDVENEYPIPAAFEKYVEYVNVKIGQEKYDTWSK